MDDLIRVKSEENGAGCDIWPIAPDRRLAFALFLCLVLAAFLILYAYGIGGYGRSAYLKENYRIDAKTFYLAGQVWLKGADPYDKSKRPVLVDGLTDDQYLNPFPYPPSSASFVMLLASLNLDLALLVYDGLSLFGLLAIIFVSLKLLETARGRDGVFLDLRKILLICLIIANIPVASVFWLGQTSIMITACLFVSYYFYCERKDVACGILLALALVKPQLSYPFLLWLILEGRGKILLAGGVMTLALFLVPFYLNGIWPTLTGWFGGVMYYWTHPITQIGSGITLSAIQRLISVAGFGNSATFISIFASLIPIALIARAAPAIPRIALLGMLSAIGLLLGRANHYDLALALTILPFFVARIGPYDYKRLGLLVIVFVLFNLPRQELLLTFDSALLASHREIILAALLLIMIKETVFSPRFKKRR